MKGIDITLISKIANGVDAFNQPVYKDTRITVSDVLVGEPSTTDIENNLTAYGKRTAYTLAIPKGDTNVWEDGEVELPLPFGGTYRVIGKPTAGIEVNIPLRWNKKVHLEQLEG